MGMAEKRSATEMKGRKPGLITKTLDRYRSMPVRQKPAEGCFSVYVGAARQRFMVRTECVNHPLFRALLEEAEEEFGYADAGPLELLRAAWHRQAYHRRPVVAYALDCMLA